MGLLIAAAALLLGYGTAYVASEDVRYVSRAGLEETRILARRVPIARLAADPMTPDSLRIAAQLVTDARTYAVRMGLDAKDTYTTYSRVERDTLLLVLTTSPRTCLCPVTWSFPIVGRVPYKGYFDFAKARKAAAEYEARGYDVYLRPSAAFSTLGWFNDPLLSTALSRDQVELAALVFHEIAHNTIWVKGATDFNESFAQWVGYRMAQRFFLERRDSAAALLAADRWHDERQLGAYYELLMGKLDSLYGLKLPADDNTIGRVRIAQWSEDTLRSALGKHLRTIDPIRLGRRPINNAALLGVRLYRTNLELFAAWDAMHDGDLAVALYALEGLVDGTEGSQAFQRMRVMLGEQSSFAPAGATPISTSSGVPDGP